MGFIALRHVGSSKIKIEPMSSALAGEFFTTEPPGKIPYCYLLEFAVSIWNILRCEIDVCYYWNMVGKRKKKADIAFRNIPAVLLLTASNKSFLLLPFSLVVLPKNWVWLLVGVKRQNQARDWKRKDLLLFAANKDNTRHLSQSSVSLKAKLGKF